MIYKEQDMIYKEQDIIDQEQGARIEERREKKSEPFVNNKFDLKLHECGMQYVQQ